MPDASKRCSCSGGRVTVDDIDSVLDEIDGVLESNAEEFVRGFVQKGGQ